MKQKLTTQNETLYKKTRDRDIQIDRQRQKQTERKRQRKTKRRGERQKQKGGGREDESVEGWGDNFHFSTVKIQEVLYCQI